MKWTNYAKGLVGVDSSQFRNGGDAKTPMQLSTKKESSYRGPETRVSVVMVKPVAETVAPERHRS